MLSLRFDQINGWPVDCSVCGKRIGRKILRVITKEGTFECFDCVGNKGVPIYDWYLKDLEWGPLQRIRKAFMQREVARGRKRKSDSPDSGGGKRRRVVCVSARMKKVVAERNVEMLRRLKRHELQALCMYNNMEMFHMHENEWCLSKYRRVDYRRSLEVISNLGMPQPCKCGGKAKNIFDNPGDKFIRYACGGVLTKCVWKPCKYYVWPSWKQVSVRANIPYPKKPRARFFGSMRWPEPWELDSADWRGDVAELLSKPFCVAGEEFQFSSSLVGELVAFLPNSMPYLFEIASGQLRNGHGDFFVNH